MTKHGNKIPSLDSGQVRDQLAEGSDGKAIKRLTAAREYMAGHSPAEIETKCGWHEQTVYGWLNRFEERDLEDALYDDKPPGRPPELSDAQFQQLLRHSTARSKKPDTTSQRGMPHLLKNICSKRSALPTLSGMFLG